MDKRTQTVSCSCCGREFKFGTVEQAATGGQHGFSHCENHRKIERPRAFCTVGLSHDEITMMGLDVPLTHCRVYSDGVVVSVPETVHSVIQTILAETRPKPEPVAVPENGAMEYYGAAGRYSGD